jgi:hypothetical protein
MILMPDQNPTEPLPTRLSLGCGWDIRPDFLNVDFVPAHNPDLVADVTNLPMLPSGYFDEIVAQDVLEHFERGKTSGALAEWSRLLSDTGTFLSTSQHCFMWPIYWPRPNRKDSRRRRGLCIKRPISLARRVPVPTLAKAHSVFDRGHSGWAPTAPFRAEMSNSHVSFRAISHAVRPADDNFSCRMAGVNPAR